MTEDQSTDVVDTSVSDEVDPSTNEEAQDADDDLDDFVLSDEDIEAAGTEETEPNESEEESPASEETEETEEESEADVDEESTETPEDIKKHNAEMAQRRIAEREAKEAAKYDQQNQFLQEAEDARDLAVRQLQVDAYNNRVEANANKLQNGIDKAVVSIDLFQSGTPEQKEALLEALDDFEAYHVRKDINGDPIEITGDVYQHLQKKADSIRRLTGVGARQETKAKQTAKARTDTLPTRAPKEPKEDPAMAAFDEEANRW